MVLHKLIFWHIVFTNHRHHKSFTMMNEVILTPNDIHEVNKLEISHPSPLDETKETPVIPLPVQRRLPPPINKKEFPISKWTMPPEQHGYIKGHDNDCL